MVKTAIQIKGKHDKRPMRILIKDTGKLLKTRENAGDQATIGFTFASDSLMHDVNFLDQSQNNVK